MGHIHENQPHNQINNGNAPNPNPNPNPAPEVPRVNELQEQPVAVQNAPIAKRRATQGKGQAKRQKVAEVADPAVQDEKQVHKTQRSITPASKRQKLNVQSQKMETISDIRCRLIDIEKSIKITPKIISSIKSGQHDEAKLRFFIRAILKTEEERNKKPHPELKGNPLLAKLALKIMQTPTDPDYISAFLYLISKHEEHREAANLKLAQFLELKDEACKRTQEHVRYKLMKAAEKKKHWGDKDQLYPVDIMMSYKKEQALPALIYIVADDLFDHPLYDSLFRESIKYWKKKFNFTDPTLWVSADVKDQVYIKHILESDWIIPLDLLQKLKKMLQDLAVDTTSQKHPLVLEIILSNEYSRKPDHKDYEKTFFIEQELYTIAKEHAVHLLQEKRALDKSLSCILKTLQYKKFINHEIVKDLCKYYLDNLSQQVIHQQDEILSHAQLGKKPEFVHEYQRILEYSSYFYRFLIKDEDKATTFENLFKETQIDKMDFLIKYVNDLYNHYTPSSLHLSILYKHFIEKWTPKEFNDFFYKLKKYITDEKRLKATETIIIDSISFFGNKETCLLCKEKIIDALIMNNDSRLYKYMDNHQNHEEARDALIRLYHFGVITDQELKPGTPIHSFVGRLNDNLYEAMPPAFKAQQTRVIKLEIPCQLTKLVSKKQAFHIRPANKHEKTIENIEYLLMDLKQNFKKLYETDDKSKWNPNILSNYKSLKANFVETFRTVKSMTNPYCITLQEILNAHLDTQTLRDKLLETLTEMRNERNNHDIYNAEYAEIQKMLDLIITTIDDETVRLHAQLTKHNFEDPLDISGQQTILLTAQIHTFMDHWAEYKSGSQEALLEAYKRVVPYLTSYYVIITCGSPVDISIPSFVETELLPALMPLCDQDPSLALLDSYSDFFKAKQEKPEDYESLRVKNIANIEKSKLKKEADYYVNLLTFLKLFQKLDIALKNKYLKHSEKMTQALQNAWNVLPWGFQTTIMNNFILINKWFWSFDVEMKRFMFKLLDPYFQKGEMPNRVLTLTGFHSLSCPKLHPKPKKENYDMRIAIQIANLYDQLPLQFKRHYTRNQYSTAAPETREKMECFIVNEITMPESAPMVTDILKNATIPSYLKIINGCVHQLIDTNFIQSPLQLETIRAAAKVTIPEVTFANHEIPDRFKKLFDTLNLTDDTKPDFISIPAALGMNDDEFARSTYKNITPDQIITRIMRFLKDLLNRNLPDDQKLVLSEKEIEEKKPWLPDPSHDAEWIKMISVMIAKISETEDPDLRSFNTCILINGLLVCPTGQASAMETTYAAIVLKRELGSKSFEEVLLHIIQDSQEAALHRALSMPDNLVGGQNVHREQLYRLILQPLYGLRKITSFQETMSRLTRWSDIKKILDNFAQQWTQSFIFDLIQKSFGTKDDCDIIARHILEPTAEATLKEIRQAKLDRPLKIFDSQGNCYVSWLMNNKLDTEEYGITFEKDQNGDIDLYNFTIEKIEITQDIIKKILTRLGYLK